MVETTIGKPDDSDSSNSGLGNEPKGGNTEPQRIGGFEFITPAQLGDAPGGDTPKRRGRPKGSRNSGPRLVEKTPQSNLIESFESLLLSVHFMAAKLLETPELELDEIEAKRLSDSLKRVAEFYPVGISPKRMAIAELCISAGAVYGPRIVTLYKKQPKKAPPARTMPTVATQPPVSQNGAPANPGVGSVPAGIRPRVPSEMWNQDGVENLQE